MKTVDSVKFMIIFFVGCAAVNVKAQNNFSGLLNSQLQRESRSHVVPLLNNVVTGLIELVKPKEDRAALNDENIAVNITRVTVLNDSRLQLLLSVKYAVSPSNPELIAEVVNKKGEPVKEFTAESVRTTNSGDALMLILLKPDATASGVVSDFFGNYLRLRTFNKDKKNYGENYFILNKKFQSGQKVMKVILPANTAMTAISQNGRIDPNSVKRVNGFSKGMYTSFKTANNAQLPQPNASSGKVKTYRKRIELGQPVSARAAQPSGKTPSKPVYMNSNIFLLNTAAAGTPGHPAPDSGHELEIIDLTNDNNLDIETDDGFTDLPGQFTNIKLDFILKTKDKGEFFYIPNSFNLKWTAGNGYDFSMTYGILSDASAGTGNVRITGTLTPKIDGDEVKLVEKFLKEYCRKKGIAFQSFSDFPAENYGNTISESLQAAFDVNKDKIFQTSSNSLKDEFTFSWIVDSKTKDDIQASLISGGGISADLSFSATESEKQYSIGVQIKLDDPQTFGHFELPVAAWRTTSFQNPTAFPVKINAVHFLDVTSNANRVNIYSCPVNKPVISPGDEVIFESSAIPKIDSKFKRIWIDYTVEKCEPCYQVAVQQLTSGPSAAAQEIKFQGIGCFEIDSITANQVTIEVRSTQFDPKGTNMVSMPAIKLTDAEAEKTVKPLFVPKSKDPQFEYRITFITKDGETRPSGWIQANNLNMIIGKKLVKDNCFRL